MLNFAKCVGLPPQLKRLDGKLGLPPMPRVDVCLHAGGDPESLALKQLRRTATEHALVELAGNKRARPAQSCLLTWNSCRRCRTEYAANLYLHLYLHLRVLFGRRARSIQRHTPTLVCRNKIIRSPSFAHGNEPTTADWQTNTRAARSAGAHSRRVGAPGAVSSDVCGDA